MELPSLPPAVAFEHQEGEGTGNTMRCVPIRHVYSSSTPCVNASGSSNVMSKKVKASKIMAAGEEGEEDYGVGEAGESRKGGNFGLHFEESACKVVARQKPVLVYFRRAKKLRHSPNRESFSDRLSRQVELDSESSRRPKEVKSEVVDAEWLDSAGYLDGLGRKRKNVMKYELLGLGEGSGYFVGFGGPRLRGSRGQSHYDGTRKRARKSNAQKVDSSGLCKAKRWVELSFEDVDPFAFVGLSCKVFWPMDKDWYPGAISSYDPEAQLHQVEYKDGDAENLTLSKEKIKFHISGEELKRLNLKYSSPDTENKNFNYDEMVALAVGYDDCQDVEAGDIVWAKLAGFAQWPALVISEANASALGVLKPNQRERTVPVQFFGTHDFARINIKQVTPFLRGLLSSFHLKCKQKQFQQSLEEANMYLSRQQLPSRMIELQKGNGGEDCKSIDIEDDERFDSGDNHSADEGLQKMVESMSLCPFEIGDLRVTSLGKIVCDSEYFHTKHFIWPEGYTASRKFVSITNPKVNTFYKMEVLRNPKLKARPLFRVTSDDGEQIEGPNPTVCWKEIYRRINGKISNGCNASVEDMLQKSGPTMFGFTNPRISQLIQGLLNSRSSSKYIENCRDLPSGYRAVRVEWKDIDRCNVCHMDEEYEDNLFLQCDKCRMMVHARCYGELEPLGGVLWFCNLCRPGAPKPPPLCCLCPVIGGAIKPTTDGRWAHLTCAMWIPETCLLDIKRMEPIDGLSRINRDRWKLLCSICGVSYGACIQCSNNNCYVAYHPLCARAAGLCVELEDEDRLHLMSVDEDDDQCIRLLSFCKKHRQPSNDRSPSEEQPLNHIQNCSTYIPPSNPSGCARCEPYNFFGRRGQKEPQVLAAASAKRLFVEDRPYLVGGYHQNGVGHGPSCSKSSEMSSLRCPKLDVSHHDTPCSISSMGEKYIYMKESYRKLLVFGKSRIHGFGVFAKVAHKAGDMVIEYIGELVRPPIADSREHLIYNSLVGAGTYMFRIDNERVIDATRAGSIAHLINHSCEPNCYSRMISVHGDEHIIIFAKRDINQWEELTYDYRFFSKDEQLACYCGFSRCRGVVNDVEEEEQTTKLLVPRSELIPWHGDCKN